MINPESIRGWPQGPSRTGVRRLRYAGSLHIRVRAFAIFGDEAVDPRHDNGLRDRAELEHSIVERADFYSGFF
jgi:hypothetical protein